MDAQTLQLADVFPESAAAGDVLRARGWTVAVAESCTGGLLGATLTAVPGSSRYVRGGVIAYDDELKTGLLGVDEGLLARHGAVSEEVAVAMARGAQRRLKADVGVGITGVAGPRTEGGKPAGLVYVAMSSPAAAKVVRLDDDQGREGNRAAAVAAALHLLVELR
jgi:nicotinamide-nucleotide amidase